MPVWVISSIGVVVSVRGQFNETMMSVDKWLDECFKFHKWSILLWLSLSSCVHYGNNRLEFVFLNDDRSWNSTINATNYSWQVVGEQTYRTWRSPPPPRHRWPRRSSEHSTTIDHKSHKNPFSSSLLMRIFKKPEKIWMLSGIVHNAEHRI